MVSFVKQLWSVVDYLASRVGVVGTVSNTHVLSPSMSRHTLAKYEQIVFRRHLSWGPTLEGLRAGVEIVVVR